MDYIETGSLAGIVSKSREKKILIPSEEVELNIYPLDFEEFLWATGDEDIFNIIREKKLTLKPFGQAMLREIMRKFRIRRSSNSPIRKHTSKQSTIGDR